MIKGSIPQEDITLANICALIIETPKYIKQILRDLKGEVNSNIIIVRDFNILPYKRDRLSRQRINKETTNLNNTMDQMELTDLYRKFPPNAEEYTFSQAYM